MAASRVENLLRPAPAAALAAWAAMVQANREQVERLRESVPAADYYAPMAEFFRADPTRQDDETLNALLRLAQPGETWLDVGAGGGRFALGVARLVNCLIAVEPSEAMRGVLEQTAAEFAIGNVALRAERWPPADLAQADVVMFTHVGYDIEAMGPFLDAVEASAERLCVAVLLERSPASLFSELWPLVHDEPAADLPALHEFLLLLHARGGLPAVQVVEGAQRWRFESLEDAERSALRRLWVDPDSDKGRRLREALPAFLEQDEGGGYRLPARNRIGLVTWTPGG